ncbi:MAG: FAD-dependent monooxygenase [Pseudomonadota bacterium]
MRDYPVVISGAGPSGLLASIILAKSGIRHLLVEQRSELHRAPAAHVLKTRTLEIYRMFGFDTAVTDIATPPELQRYVTYFDQLAGLNYGKLSLYDFRKDAAFKDKSPTRTANLPQDLLEEILYAKATESDLAEIEFDTSCSDHQDAGDAVHIEIERPGGEKETIRAQYFIAAEGAGSPTRRRMGIEMEGPAGIAHYVTVYFESDLSKLLKGGEGIVHWCLNLDTPASLIVHDHKKRAVLMIPYDPETQSPEDFPKSTCAAYLKNVLGDANHPFEIVTIDKWTMTAQVAERYSQGRVYLVGDAAHRFPPTGGLGLNTGAQDVYNLLWKVREVLSGNADPGLLKTYETECRPIAKANCEHSLINQKRNIEVPLAIGITDDKAASRENVEALRRGGPESEQRLKKIAHAIDGQLRHYVSFGLDLAFVYEHGALLSDGTPVINRIDDPTIFEPTAQPGARLPHTWLNHKGERVSSHDLLSYNNFTLIIGSDGEIWTEALNAMADVPFHVEVKEVGRGCTFDDPEGDWQSVSELTSTGALLVRPDGHVALREKSAPADPKARLAQAIDALLPNTIKRAAADAEKLAEQVG